MRKAGQDFEYAVYKLSARIATRIVSKNQIAEVLGDLDTSPRTSSDEMIKAVRAAVGNEWRARFYPGVRVSDEMPFKQRASIYTRLYTSICRMNVAWLIVFYLVATTGTLFIPDEHKVDLWSSLIVGGVAMLLAQSYTGGFRIRPRRDELLSISIFAYLQGLKAWIRTLFDGAWSPSKALGRSLMEAFLFLLLLFGPAAAFLRRYAGLPLARDQVWLAVWLRLVVVILMMVSWFYLKKANNLVAEILKCEFKRQSQPEDD